MLDPLATAETVRWQAYPSWRQFAWLYLMSLLASARGLLLVTLEIPGWMLWLGGAGVLLVCAACLRRWAQYRITSGRVVVRNGYTGREIEAIPIDRIAAITLRQGPIAHLMGIGTLVVGTAGGGQVCLQGIADPDVVRTRLQAMRPASDAPAD